jgi:polyferredoxin
MTPLLPSKLAAGADSRESPQMWRRLRQVCQYLTLALFFYLLFGMRPEAVTILPTDLFFRLDPLAALVASLASRFLLAGLLLSMITIGLTLLFGRVWCGWLCPLGTVLDIFTLRRHSKETIARPSRWRHAKYITLIAIVTAAIFGNQTLMVLDPITLITRTGATVVIPTLEVGVTAAQNALYRVPFLQAPVIWVDNLLRGAVLPIEHRHFQLNLLTALVFVALIALNRISHRFWCRHLCPLGGLLALVSRLAWLRRRVTPACTSCGRCAQICPTGAIDASAGYVSSPAECTMCFDCQPVCPVNAIQFWGSLRRRPAAISPTPTRRQVLGALALSAFGVGLVHTLPRPDDVSPHLILPPGGRENHLAQKCIRCGACLQVCPTGALQPAWSQGGLASAWTPVLTPRLGYCDYSCNACGDVCPTSAIPALPLDVKRTVVIGKSYIDTHRCIPWADHQDCIVCEEMCPVPDKAIKLDDTPVTLSDGRTVIVRLPRVERERCIGCGHCENQCPVAGEAAIRVYTPTAL